MQRSGFVIVCNAKAVLVQVAEGLGERIAIRYLVD
jgi:hypothetical protein